MSEIQGLDISELDEFAKELIELAVETMPSESKKFLRKEGNELRKEIVKTAKARVKQRTGNYVKGIKRGKVYKYNGEETAIRVYHVNEKGGKLENGKFPAPHAHLIEYGHRIVDKNKNEKGFKRGYHVYRDASKNYEKQFASNCEKFVDDMLDKGLH